MAGRRKRVLGYVRVSTAEQADGYGPAAQEAAIRRYCEAHHLRPIGIESDLGESGANGLDTRLGLARALARLEAGEATALVVARLDRLARDYALQELTITKLAANGTPVLSASEDVDTDTDDPTRVLVRQIIGSIGQYERAVIRGRMMAGKAAKVARGGYGGGRPRYGTRAEAGELVSDPDEQRLVERIAELRKYTNPALSYRQICEVLTAEGFKPRRAQHWQPNVVRRIAARV